MYGYIYLTTNKITGHLYIGQHKASEFTESYKGSGKRLQQAIKRYGWDAFEVKMLKKCESQRELNLAEIECIRVYREAFGKRKLYNIKKGGQSPCNKRS